MEARIFINFLELIAFILSIYYYKRVETKQAKWLSFFLGATVFVEILSFYTQFVADGMFLSSLKGTPFEDNYWIYNPFMLISAVFYIYYFRSILVSRKFKTILTSLLFVLATGSVLHQLFSGVFFIGYSPFTVIVGTVFILASIAFFYLELLNSNLILKVHKTLPFYVSVAVLIFYLCTTPLFIYSTYFSESLNPKFYQLYIRVIISTNFIMYSIYIIGFIVCTRKRNQY